MTPEQRALTFWLVCIPLRSSLACVVRVLTSPTAGTTHPALRALATVPAYRWLRGLEVGDEGVLGGPTPECRSVGVSEGRRSWPPLLHLMLAGPRKL